MIDLLAVIRTERARACTWIVTNGRTGEQHEQTSTDYVTPEEFMCPQPSAASAPPHSPAPASPAAPASTS